MWRREWEGENIKFMKEKRTTCGQDKAIGEPGSLSATKVHKQSRE